MIKEYRSMETLQSAYNRKEAYSPSYIVVGGKRYLRVCTVQLVEANNPEKNRFIIADTITRDLKEED